MGRSHAYAIRMNRQRQPTPVAARVHGFRGGRGSSRRTPEDSARVLAAWVLERTEASLAPASVYLESALARCDPRDRALLRELTLGTLRWRRRLDHVISRASNRPFSSIERLLRAPLRLAAYQLLFLDRVPPHAAVHEAVEEARRLTHRGGASFANAVLRRIARDRDLAAWTVGEKDPVRRLGVELSHPDFLVSRWMHRFGEQRTRDLLAANNRPKPVHLLTFRDRGGREPLAESLIDAGYEVLPSEVSPLGLIVRQGQPLELAAFRDGDLYIQDEASQAAALLPPPRPGEKVLDAAAAPGGKSFALLAYEPELQLTLADLSLGRLDRMQSNLRRLGRKLPVLAQDAARPALGGTFDRVLLDLPCTGTGTLRKHPELKWRISEAEIGRLARQALEMMLGAAPLVSPGGLLIAITCSLEEEENERVIGEFLTRQGDFHPMPLESHLERPLDRWIFGPGAWRMLPAGDHDGFTVHALIRSS